MLFYFLTVVLTGLRIYYAIWFFQQRTDQHLFLPILTPIVKINIGLVQCWMLYELSLRVQQSIRLSNLEEQHFDEVV